MSSSRLDEKEKKQVRVKQSSIVWLTGSGATHGLQRQMAMPRAYKSVLELVDFIYERENEDETKGNICMS